MTSISIEDEVACPPDEALVRLASHLGSAQYGAGATPYHLEVPFEDVGLPKLGAFGCEVELAFGRATRHRSFAQLAGMRIPIVWRVPDNRSFPVFAGHIELMPLSAHRTAITVTGSYRPPLGPAGAAFDAVLGRRIAESTTRHFVAALKRALESAGVAPS